MLLSVAEQEVRWRQSNQQNLSEMRAAQLPLPLSADVEVCLRASM